MVFNTKLVEDLNKLQREHECRDTNRQEVSPSLSWRAGIQHNLLGTYDRQEIKVSCLTNMPRDYESDAFYNRNIVKNETAEHKKLQHDLKKVTGPATWYICTPESQQQTLRTWPSSQRSAMHTTRSRPHGMPPFFQSTRW